jgi:hypothetical protein
VKIYEGDHGVFIRKSNVILLGDACKARGRGDVTNGDRARREQCGRDWREDAMEQDTGWLHVGWFP